MTLAAFGDFLLDVLRGGPELRFGKYFFSKLSVMKLPQIQSHKQYELG